MVIAFTYGLGIGIKVLLADDAALELIDEALQIAERSADDFALGHARYALGLALMHRDSPADRERGLTALTQLRDMCLYEHWTLSEVPMIESYVAWEQARRGDLDGAIAVLRAAVDDLFQAGQFAWCIPPTGMFVETLLTRGGEADLQEAQTAIERLAAAPNHEMVDREILSAAAPRAAGRRPWRRGRPPRSPPAIPRHGHKAWPARAYGDVRFVDCPHCGGRRKPNVICFGENVPKSPAEQAHSIFNGAEATSLTVSSAGRFVRCGAAHVVGSVVVGLKSPRRQPSDSVATPRPAGISPLLADTLSGLPPASTRCITGTRPRCAMPGRPSTCARHGH